MVIIYNTYYNSLEAIDSCAAVYRGMLHQLVVTRF